MRNFANENLQPAPERESYFIRLFIINNKILTRHFYIIIPFRPADNKADFDLIREQLKLRIDIIAKGVARLGMRADQLDSLEVLDLFYIFYSPAQAKTQPLTERALQTIHTALVRDGSEIKWLENHAHQPLLKELAT